VTVLDGRAAVLIPWIEGDTPEPNTVTSCDALEQIGVLCGRLHRLGSEYPAAETLEAAGRVLSSQAAESQRGSDKRAALIRLATQTDDAEIKDEVVARLAVLNTFGEALALRRQQAPRGIIHGDFFCTHVVFRGDRAVGVIDLLGEWYMPGWELMRSFFQSVPSAFDSLTFDEALWRAYAAGYASEHHIDSRAVAAAYDEYLLQLTGSTYGLQSPMDDALRQFGRWRTRLAEYLASNRDEVRTRMAAAMTT
jgi:Ser/Thr protein kinase RdoA (MazF antagonist)